MWNSRAPILTGAVALAIAGLPKDVAAQEEALDDERVEYVSTADATELLHDDLAAFDGGEVRVYTFDFPAGWIGDWHYHTGDVFVYVMEGELIIEPAGEDRVTIGPGEVYHEAVDQLMQARNGSATRPTRVLLFQVGAAGEPLMIRADPESRP